jgi:RNA polymerase sigma factor (sigma-70 family)
MECPTYVGALYAGSPAPPDSEAAVAELFAARYAEMVRLAGLLGADDAEDVAQEAFARLLGRHSALRDQAAAIGYVRATVCNLTRNRGRHLGIARRAIPRLALVDGPSLEQAAIAREDHEEVLAAVAALPGRQREAVVLRYWLELSEAEIAAVMGVAAGTVKSLVSRGVASVGKKLEALS